MKTRLIALIVSLVTVFGLTVSVAAAPQRFWWVDMSKPTAETASRTIKVNYNVFSTLESDDEFTVNLIQNGNEISSQSVTNGGGNSGVFTVDIPSTGTYTYQVKATNAEAGETKTSENAYTVEVVNEPEPIVNVVTVNNGGADGQVAQAAAAGGGEVAQAGEDEGQDGAAANEGQTTGQAAGDQAADTGDGQEEGEVLGEESFGDRVGNTAPYVLIPAAIAILGYLLYRSRQSVDAE